MEVLEKDKGSTTYLSSKVEWSDTSSLTKENLLKNVPERVNVYEAIDYLVSVIEDDKIEGLVKAMGGSTLTNSHGQLVIIIGGANYTIKRDSDRNVASGQTFLVIRGILSEAIKNGEFRATRLKYSKEDIVAQLESKRRAVFYLVKGHMIESSPDLEQFVHISQSIGELSNLKSILGSYANISQLKYYEKCVFCEEPHKRGADIDYWMYQYQIFNEVIIVTSCRNCAAEASKHFFVDKQIPKYWIHSNDPKTFKPYEEIICNTDRGH